MNWLVNKMKIEHPTVIIVCVLVLCTDRKTQNLCPLKIECYETLVSISCVWLCGWEAAGRRVKISIVTLSIF